MGHKLDVDFNVRRDREFMEDLRGVARSKHFLVGIVRPTLVLHALDDPWIPGACYSTLGSSSRMVISLPRQTKLSMHQASM
jgi:hypothetical protein